MVIISSAGISGSNSFLEAVTRELPEDGGVFRPGVVPMLPDAFFMNFHRMTFDEICFIVASTLIGEDISSEGLREVISESVTEDLPLDKVADRVYALARQEMTGDWESDKSGAIFPVRLIEYMRAASGDKRLLTVVIPADDFGAFVAGNLFSKAENVRIVMLSSRHSPSFTKKIRTFGDAENVDFVKINGSKEQCERLLGRMMNDKELRQRIFLCQATARNPVIVLNKVIQFFQALARLVALRKSEGFAGEEVLGRGVVFYVHRDNEALKEAAPIARRMGLPFLRLEYIDDDTDISSLPALGDKEIGVVIPNVHMPDTGLNNESRKPVIRLAPSFPALKQYFSNL